MESTKPTSNLAENGNKSKPLLCDVSLILLYDYNVKAKEIKTKKIFAIVRGFFWKYNILFHFKRDFLICDV